MKKLVAFVLLFSVLTSSAFAQLTLRGSAYIGIQLEKEDGSDAAVSAHHRKEGTPLFNFAAIASRENFGVKLDTSFRYTGTNDTSADFSLEGIYGWANLWDNSLRLTLGKISDPVWVVNLNPRLPVWSFDDIKGFRLEYRTPLPGLSVGTALRTEGDDPGQIAKWAIFGAAYFHPLFNIVFAYDLSRNAQTLLGVNFTGINALTAGLQLRAIHLASWSSDPVFYGQLEMFQKAAYRVIRPLELSLILGQRIYGLAGKEVFLSFMPGVSYRFSPNLTALFDIEVNSDNQFSTTNMIVTPSIEFSLGGPALLYFQYQLELPAMSNPIHRIGFGLEIRAF